MNSHTLPDSMLACSGGTQPETSLSSHFLDLFHKYRPANCGILLPEKPRSPLSNDYFFVVKGRVLVMHVHATRCFPVVTLRLLRSFTVLPSL